MKRFLFLLMIVMVTLSCCIHGVFAQDASSRDISDRFLEVIEELTSDGKISTDDGDYYYLDDFTEAWAQLQWYQWEEKSEAEMADFVLRSVIDYSSASSTPNWSDSGCGWLFRGTDSDYNLFAYYSLDGNVYLEGKYNNKWVTYGQKYIARPSTGGEVEMVIFAEGRRVGVMINGVQAVQTFDSAIYGRQAPLHSVVFSGTNKDYGTRCKYSEIEFMVIR